MVPKGVARWWHDTITGDSSSLPREARFTRRVLLAAPGAEELSCTALYQAGE